MSSMDPSLDHHGSAWAQQQPEAGLRLLWREDSSERSSARWGLGIRASFGDGTGTRVAPLVLPQRWANRLRARTSKSKDPGFCFKLKPLLRFEWSHLKYFPSISPRQQAGDPREPMKSPTKFHRP